MRSDCLETWIKAAPSLEARADAADKISGIGAQDAADDGDAILDPDVLGALRAMTGGRGDRLINRVITLFVQHAPGLQANIEAAAGGSPQAMAEAAHALKSMCRNVGARQLGELCEALENAGRDGQAADPGLIAALPEAVARTTRALQEYAGEIARSTGEASAARAG